ncbi:MAG: KTSC domain-containing protein [Bacteroidota bacterium]|nr:KTSC domain-containing protein [Bacteroidota bacterium]
MKSISEINYSKEGKLLLAAIAIITTESQTDKTPDEVLEQIVALSDKMYRVDIKEPPYGGVDTKTWPDSKMVAETEYNHESKELRVVFRNGSAYTYTDFPFDKWKELIECESVGQYINKVVKPNYKIEVAKPSGLINLPENYL